MKHQTAVISRILKLGIILNSVISYIPLLLLPQQNSPRYPLDSRLGASSSRYGKSGEENNHLQFQEIETESLVAQLVAYPLHRLTCPGPI